MSYMNDRVTQYDLLVNNLMNPSIRKSIEISSLCYFDIYKTYTLDIDKDDILYIAPLSGYNVCAYFCGYFNIIVYVLCFYFSIIKINIYMAFFNAPTVSFRNCYFYNVVLMQTQKTS